MNQTNDIEELKDIACRMRIDTLKMLNAAGSGHPGGSLSAMEILVALYFSKMNHSPGSKPGDIRDRFVLSKGHAAPALYAMLAEQGYFEKSHLLTLRKYKSILSGHPYVATPGVDVTTGSLGQGLSQANGIALALRLNKENSNVYCLLGDGEVQEGQVWEAAMTAAHYKLGSVIAIQDNNQIQIDGFCKDVMNVQPLGEKWRAFGWHVQEIDGHDFGPILEAIENAKSKKDKPSLIWAHTVKGKGVSFMENKAEWHGVAPNDEELKKALAEISAQSTVPVTHNA
ncbi:MAG: transketolase [bacterium]|nr:MAG: transketolase [bacterium]